MGLFRGEYDALSPSVPSDPLGVRALLQGAASLVTPDAPLFEVARPAGAQHHVHHVYHAPPSAQPDLVPDGFAADVQDLIHRDSNVQQHQDLHHQHPPPRGMFSPTMGPLGGGGMAGMREDEIRQGEIRPDQMRHLPPPRAMPRGPLRHGGGSAGMFTSPPPIVQEMTRARAGRPDNRSDQQLLRGFPPGSKIVGGGSELSGSGGRMRAVPANSGTAPPNFGMAGPPHLSPNMRAPQPMPAHLMRLGPPSINSMGPPPLMSGMVSNIASGNRGMGGGMHAIPMGRPPMAMPGPPPPFMSAGMSRPPPFRM